MKRVMRCGQEGTDARRGARPCITVAAVIERGRRYPLSALIEHA